MAVSEATVGLLEVAPFVGGETEEESATKPTHTGSRVLKTLYVD